MTVTGLITEYNPFHNGHALHLKQAKRQTKADVIIAVMSGSFVQRGEPAILPKWERAKIALQAGVDLVVELPVYATLQQADIFAHSAIKILHALKVQQLFFGCEHGRADDFVTMAQILIHQHTQFEVNLKHYLTAKLPYPKAFAKAVQRTAPHLSIDITQPNNILALHYALAVKRQQTNIKLEAMPRRFASFHDDQLIHSNIASATAIRSAWLKGKTEATFRFIPETTKNALDAYTGKFLSWEDYYPFLRYRLLTSSSSQLTNIKLVSEGIENRMKRAAVHATTFADFLEQVKTKRYSNARLQRTAMHILLNLSKEEFQGQEYIRILGMSAQGRKHLAKMKQSSLLPIISTVSKSPPQWLAADIKATNVYTLPPSLKTYRQGDFRIPPYLA